MWNTSSWDFIEGGTGWVVIDPLTFEETARASLALVTEQLGRRPISAVIYTHSHIDHYGGIRGILTDEQIAAGEIPIVAPDGFLAAAVAENIVAEPVMGRRALYQDGMTLPWSPLGHVDQGLGKGVPIGTTSMVPPTIDITETGQELTLDGVRIEFQLTPDTEAPAEMHIYFPDHRVLCLAENCTATMHNVVTLRGAVVRDALRWSRSIQEAIDRYGHRSDVAFASHHWPHWGTEVIADYMANQRDLYRWIHDQTLRLANLGRTPTEIAEELELPPGLWDDYRCHGYYGTLSHNVKAVYQRYLGWYDGHPASLEPHTPAEAGRRYVDLAGGIDALVEKARVSYDEGDYRWVAEVLRHAVFAQPDHRRARTLQAAAFEQLGYQAEAGPWRDVYLTAAQELRSGTPDLPFPVRPRHAVDLGLDEIFDYLAVRLDGPAATALGPLLIDWQLPGTHEQIRVELSNGTLHSTVDRAVAGADVVVTSDRRRVGGAGLDRCTRRRPHRSRRRHRHRRRHPAARAVGEPGPFRDVLRRHRALRRSADRLVVRRHPAPSRANLIGHSARIGGSHDPNGCTRAGFAPKNRRGLRRTDAADPRRAETYESSDAHRRDRSSAPARSGVARLRVGHRDP